MNQSIRQKETHRRLKKRKMPVFAKTAIHKLIIVDFNQTDVVLWAKNCLKFFLFLVFLKNFSVSLTKTKESFVVYSWHSLAIWRFCVAYLSWKINGLKWKYFQQKSTERKGLKVVAGFFLCVWCIHVNWKLYVTSSHIWLINILKWVRGVVWKKKVGTRFFR